MSLPVGNWFLNSKERKKISKALDEQFGIAQLPEGVYVQNAKDKVYLINRAIEEIDYEALRIDSIGLYIGTWQIDGFRLSMEGAQLFAPLATKNVVLFSDAQKNAWLKGGDILWNEEKNTFVIVKHETSGDVLGCGKLRSPREGRDESAIVLNYVPKARRLVVINE